MFVCVSRLRLVPAGLGEKKNRNVPTSQSHSLGNRLNEHGERDDIERLGNVSAPRRSGASDRARPCNAGSGDCAGRRGGGFWDAVGGGRTDCVVGSAENCGVYVEWGHHRSQGMCSGAGSCGRLDAFVVVFPLLWYPVFASYASYAPYAVDRSHVCARRPCRLCLR